MTLNGLFRGYKKSTSISILDIIEDARKKNVDPNIFMYSFIQRMQVNTLYRDNFLFELNNFFKGINFIDYICNSGIYSEDSFIFLFKKKIIDFLLPNIENNNELTSKINEIFYNSKNLKFISSISREDWNSFFIVLFKDVSEDYLKNICINLQNQIIQILSILSSRIIGDFSNKHIMRYSCEIDYISNPFYKLCFNINNIIDKKDEGFDLLHLKESILECKKMLNDIKIQKDYKGISLKVAIKINRLDQLLVRLQDVLTVYNDFKLNNLNIFFSNFIKKIIEIYSPKNYIRKQLSSTLYIITFLVTYHNGKVGEKYIAQNIKDYNKIFISSFFGGLIVSILCFFKFFISSIPNTSPLFKAFFYSLNYSLGFCIIYVLKFILATKQPSMTAAILGQSLSNSDNEINKKHFTMLFSQILRSQIIAFIGNVISAMLFCFFLSYIINLMGYNFISEYKSYLIFNELTNFDINIFYFAFIAGIFLFLSGVVSGAVTNNIRFNNIRERIYNHPILKNFFSDKKRYIISIWIEKNMGGVVGNLIFGFLMGTAFLLGDFAGIYFDVRHITFSAGNFAIAIFKNNYYHNFMLVFKGLIFIFLIGWCNFIVSFLLSLIMAIKSNNISIFRVFNIFEYTLKQFIKNPIPFLIPINFFKNYNDE